MFPEDDRTFLCKSNNLEHNDFFQNCFTSLENNHPIDFSSAVLTPKTHSFKDPSALKTAKLTVENFFDDFNLCDLDDYVGDTTASNENICSPDPNEYGQDHLFSRDIGGSSHINAITADSDKGSQGFSFDQGRAPFKTLMGSSDSVTKVARCHDHIAAGEVAMDPTDGSSFSARDSIHQVNFGCQQLDNNSSTCLQSFDSSHASSQYIYAQDYPINNNQFKDVSNLAPKSALSVQLERFKYEQEHSDYESLSNWSHYSEDVQRHSSSAIDYGKHFGSEHNFHNIVPPSNGRNSTELDEISLVGDSQLGTSYHDSVTPCGSIEPLSPTSKPPIETSIGLSRNPSMSSIGPHKRGGISIPISSTSGRRYSTTSRADSFAGIAKPTFRRQQSTSNSLISAYLDNGELLGNYVSPGGYSGYDLHMSRMSSTSGSYSGSTHDLAKEESPISDSVYVPEQSGYTADTLRMSGSQTKPVSLTSSPSASINKQPILKQTQTSTSVKSIKDTNAEVAQDIECTNCHTKKTPLWRRNPEGSQLCNACGLFLKLHGETRPLHLKSDVIKKRNRNPSKLKKEGDVKSQLSTQTKCGPKVSHNEQKGSTPISNRSKSQSSIRKGDQSLSPSGDESKPLSRSSLMGSASSFSEPALDDFRSNSQFQTPTEYSKYVGTNSSKPILHSHRPYESAS